MPDKNMRNPSDQVKDLPNWPRSQQRTRVPRLGPVGVVPENESKNKRK